MFDGIINIYKEKGYTSHDVVAKLRGILGMRRIGHTGTLDPDATGVLPVCVGKATSLCEYLTDKDKEYVAEIHFGIVTDTLDLSGEIIEKNECDHSIEKIKEVFKDFIGEQEQIPPMYSAIKVNGKKLYELARSGKEIERKPRRIIIKELEILSFDRAAQILKIRTVVSKGTYIRSLCDDIGKKLGSGACMGELIRTRSGIFNIKDAVTLEHLSEMIKEKKDIPLSPVESVFSMKKMKSCPEYDRLIANGNSLKPEMLTEFDSDRSDNAGSDGFINTGEDDICIYMSDGRFAAVYRYDRGKTLYKPLKMFL